MKTLFAIFGLGTLGLFNTTGVATTSIPSPYKFALTTTEVRKINLNTSLTASTTKLDTLKIKKKSKTRKRKVRT